MAWIKTQISVRIALAAWCGIAGGACFGDLFTAPGVRDVEIVYAGDSIIEVGTRWRPRFVVSVDGSVLVEPRLAYVSSDTTVIAVREDSLIARRRGRSTIVATVVSSVLPGNTPSVTNLVQAVAKAVTLDRSSVILTALGDTTSLIATAVDVNDDPMPLAAPNWSSSDTTVVTVSQQGRLFARGNGTVGVRAIVDFDTAMAEVVVKQTATAIQIAGGNNQSGGTNKFLAVPLSVRVVDAGANPVTGVSVTFAVTAGGGTLNGSNATVANVITDSAGLAEVRLKLGVSPGPNSVTGSVTSASIDPVTFTATGTL